MSVVTRWRSTFSSSTTQLSLLPVCFSQVGESFCITTICELLTVAMVMVAADAGRASPQAQGEDRGQGGDPGELRAQVHSVVSSVYWPGAGFCSLLGTGSGLSAPSQAFRISFARWQAACSQRATDRDRRAPAEGDGLASCAAIGYILALRRNPRIWKGFRAEPTPRVRWQSGDAADCKSAYVGSIPARTSTCPTQECQPRCA